MSATGSGGPRTAGLAARGWIPTVPQVVIFYTITFAFSWALFLPYTFGIFSLQREEFIPLALGIAGPSVTAFVIAGVTAGRHGLLELWRQSSRWRVGASWYAVALVGPGLADAVALGIGVTLGGQLSAIAPVIPAVANGLLAGLFEEFGWSGVAFPGLQARYGLARAGAVVGALLALWHLPFFFTPGLSQYDASFVLFLLAGPPLRILFGWIYNGSGGSILLMILFHGSLDAWGETLSFRPAVFEPAWLSFTVILWVAAVVVVLRDRGPKAGSK
jgi:membrane protease YdiL (CAAX protease family)